MVPKKTRTLWLPLVLMIAPGVLAFLFIHQFAVNVPYWDQWEFIPTLRQFREGDPGWLKAAWHPQVSHRLFLPKLIFLTLAQLSSWNVLAEIYLGYALSWLYLVVLLMIYKRTSDRSLWGFVPVVWITFSLSQWENILWGWQVAIYLLIVGLAFTIYLLSLSAFVWVVVASVFAAVASLSFINGLLLWPVGLLLLLVIRAERKAVLFWAISGILFTILYFRDYAIASNQPSLANVFSAPLTSLNYFVANVGAAIGGANVTDARLLLATGAGLFLLCSILLILWHSFSSQHGNHRPIPPSTAVLGALLLFSLASSTFITIGRVGLGRIEWALSSRYMTITSIGVISIYLLLLNIVSGEKRRPLYTLWFALFLLLLAGGQILHTAGGYRMGQIQHENRVRAQHALLTGSELQDAVLQPLYTPGVIRKHTPYLQEENLSLFAGQWFEDDIVYRAAPFPAAPQIAVRQ